MNKPPEKEFATVEQMAALDFEAWDANDPQCIITPEQFQRIFENAQLAVKVAYSLLFKTKDDLVVMFDTQREAMMESTDFIGDTGEILGEMAEILTGARARLFSAASVVATRTEGGA